MNNINFTPNNLLMYLALLIMSLGVNAQAFATEKTNQCQSNATFNVGAGIYDITGPAAEQGMMGYGMLEQKTNGIVQRLWARAFVIESPCNGNRVVYVNADLGQVFQAVKQHVIIKLQNKYGNQYNDENVLITATHTHSGPGGYSTYAFYNLTILGFSRKNFDTITDGIVAAIDRAQTNMVPARIRIASGELAGIGHNRSPESYQLNPIEERNHFQRDIDTQMTLIRFDSLEGKPIGMINWYPLHGTAMNNKNGLINGDSYGYAEYLFEKSMQVDDQPFAFVAAFSQANSGDVSPNFLGHDGGTGDEGIKNIERVGIPLYEKAKKLYNNATEVVVGGVDFRHRFVDMGHVQVSSEYTNGKTQTTCPAAIGISMLAGTHDGEGIGWQGITCDTIHKVLPYVFCEMVTTNCQGDKPIISSLGTMQPYPWSPQILPMQVVKVGNLIIGAVPMELTTMVGRRLKNSISQQLPISENYHVVLSALSNAYASYVTTYEEYELQRYEGASTHFGPWTSAALQQIFSGLTNALLNNTAVDKGPEPIDLIDKQSTLQTDVVFDSVLWGRQFGDVYQNVKQSYKLGEKAEVIFWGAHPKNNYRIQGTFLEVQHLVDDKWLTVRTDNDWDTEYHWKRYGISESLVTIVWRIPKDMTPGQYRIVHHGDWKFWWGGEITPYTGYSAAFTVQK